ncbi:caspase domain-containing protein [Melanogaster broomeanus]|nr:caspase domain-containing protein [Melanogaster broomeanus]
MSEASAPLANAMFPTDKPMGKKRALLIAVRETELLESTLIASHGYKEEDVILMLDNLNHPKHLWSTYENILTQINHLVSDVPEHCQFFLYYSGHALQEKRPEDASTELPERPNNQEADKKDEEIVACDGKPILDDLLHDRLITPLERVKGSKLFALFDCCHSETLLDLQHGNGRDTYSREWKVGIGPVFKDFSKAGAQILRLCKKYCEPVHECPPIPRLQSEVLSDTPTSNTKNVASNNVGEAHNLSVICLSACKDNQIAHDDDSKRLTFTKCFLNAIGTELLVLTPVLQHLIHTIANKPDMSWEELRDELKERVDEIRIRSQQSPALPQIWSQEPRYSTTPHTDLTKKMEF